MSEVSLTLALGSLIQNQGHDSGNLDQGVSSLSSLRVCLGSP
jgi:hypothetical protein